MYTPARFGRRKSRYSRYSAGVYIGDLITREGGTMGKKVTWDTHSRLYGLWQGMIGRCYCEGSGSWKWYGANGIDVCDEWRNYGSFEQWALSSGYSDDLTLDRIDGSRGYYPDNCRWVTWKQQQNNRRNNRVIEHGGETHTISEWAEIKGIPTKTLFKRIDHSGWDVERALTTPVDPKKNTRGRSKYGISCNG